MNAARTTRSGAAYGDDSTRSSTQQHPGSYDNDRTTGSSVYGQSQSQSDTDAYSTANTGAYDSQRSTGNSRAYDSPRGSGRSGASGNANPQPGLDESSYSQQPSSGTAASFDNDRSGQPLGQQNSSRSGGQQSFGAGDARQQGSSHHGAGADIASAATGLAAGAGAGAYGSRQSGAPKAGQLSPDSRSANTQQRSSEYSDASGRQGRGDADFGSSDRYQSSGATRQPGYDSRQYATGGGGTQGSTRSAAGYGGSAITDDRSSANTNTDLRSSDFSNSGSQGGAQPNKARQQDALRGIDEQTAGFRTTKHQQGPVHSLVDEAEELTGSSREPAGPIDPTSAAHRSSAGRDAGSAGSVGHTGSSGHTSSSGRNAGFAAAGAAAAAGGTHEARSSGRSGADSDAYRSQFGGQSTGAQSTDRQSGGAYGTQSTGAQSTGAKSTGEQTTRASAPQGYNSGAHPGYQSTGIQSDAQHPGTSGSQGYASGPRGQTGAYGGKNQAGQGVAQTGGIYNSQSQGNPRSAHRNLGQSTTGADDDFGARADDISLQQTKEAKHKSFLDKAKNLVK